MPDIYNLTTNELYEIKPARQAADAAAKAAAEVDLLNSAGVQAALGSSTAPGTSGVVEAPGGYAVYSSPTPGVITYTYAKGEFEPVPVPVAVPERHQTPAFSSGATTLTAGDAAVGAGVVGLGIAGAAALSGGGGGVMEFAP